MNFERENKPSFLKSCLLSTSIAISLSSGSVLAAGEVSLLTWEGYADDSFITKFEENSGCKVSAAYVGSNDDFAPKLAAGGGVYDLITPSIDTTKIMVEAGFVDPSRSFENR